MKKVLTALGCVAGALMLGAGQASAGVSCHNINAREVGRDLGGRQLRRRRQGRRTASRDLSRKPRPLRWTRSLRGQRPADLHDEQGHADGEPEWHVRRVRLDRDIRDVQHADGPAAAARHLHRPVPGGRGAGRARHRHRSVCTARSPEWCSTRRDGRDGLPRTDLRPGAGIRLYSLDHRLRGRRRRQRRHRLGEARAARCTRTALGHGGRSTFPTSPARSAGAAAARSPAPTAEWFIQAVDTSTGTWA